jgi:hypothetical protein
MYWVKPLVNSKLTWVPAGEDARSTWVPTGVKQPSEAKVSATGEVKANTSPCASQGVPSVQTARTAAASGSVKEQVVAVPVVVYFVV